MLHVPPMNRQLIMKVLACIPAADASVGPTLAARPSRDEILEEN